MFGKRIRKLEEENERLRRELDDLKRLHEHTAQALGGRIDTISNMLAESGVGSTNLFGRYTNPVWPTIQLILGHLGLEVVHREARHELVERQEVGDADSQS